MNTYREPTEKEIRDLIKSRNGNWSNDYYTTREELRRYYNGAPPFGSNWGEYWKNF